MNTDINETASTRVPVDMLPQHVGIIMDGNGRWAKQKGLSRSEGHIYGADVFDKISKYANRRGLKHLTVYAFSTENWRRPQEEIDGLMVLFKEYLEKAIREFEEQNIAIRFLGDISLFKGELHDLIVETQERSKKQTGMVLNIAMNYGGRAELVHAFRKIADKVKSGDISPDEIDDQMISMNLDTAGQPDPDLIIRPSGEYRTSNFMLWQSAYAEYVFMSDVLWPDFTIEHLEQAFTEYARRSRRFGGV